MKYPYEVVRDLTPLCMDGIASPESEKIVREHTAECTECAAEWAKMQADIVPEPPAELPADTVKYKETAKRIRSRNRRIQLLIFGLVLLAVGMYARTLYTGGAHFSMHRVMEELVQADIAEQIYTDEYSQVSNHRVQPYLEYQYLGEIKNSKGLAACAYAFVKHPEKELYSFSVCAGSRPDPFHFHLMYELAGGSWCFQPFKYGIYMSDGGFSQISQNNK